MLASAFFMSGTDSGGPVVGLREGDSQVFQGEIE